MPRGWHVTEGACGRFDKWAVKAGTVCGAEAGVGVVCMR